MRLPDDIHVNSHTVHIHIDVAHQPLGATVEVQTVRQINFLGKVLLYFLLFYLTLAVV